MKILLIASSPHKRRSKTFLLAQEALRGAMVSGAKTEIIHLADCQINFCCHCEACHKKILQCPIKDGVREILKRMLDADGIILATPNYINQVTASMKALFDRSAHFIHCKRLLGKYVAGVVTSGSGENKEVLDYLKYYAHNCAAQYSGGVSSGAMAIEEKKEEAFELGKRIVLDIKEKKEYPEQLIIIQQGKERFRKIILSRKKEWEQEYLYWLEHGFF